MEKAQKYLKLSDIECYRIAFNLSNYVWNVVLKWDWFTKKTVGTQFVEAVDSISANIAEGFGRYHKKIKSNFIDTAKVQTKKALTGIKNQKLEIY